MDKVIRFTFSIFGLRWLCCANGVNTESFGIVVAPRPFYQIAAGSIHSRNRLRFHLVNKGKGWHNRRIVAAGHVT